VKLIAEHEALLPGAKVTLNTPPDFHFALTEVTQLYGNDLMLEKNGLSGLRLMELMGKVKATKQAIVVDACEAGGLVKTDMFRGGAEEKAIQHDGLRNGRHRNTQTP
jgi:hypothetical protein